MFWLMDHTLSSMLEVGDAVALPEKDNILPLSQTTEQVLRIMLDGDLSRLRADSVAEALGVSGTTLRRRLRADHTCYQFLLDRVRQYRCEKILRDMWLPGKCLAVELGYLEVNSFYRAFRRWTGLSYSDYKLRYYPLLVPIAGEKK
jgi:AraC-like DNA-binding protein